MRTQAKKMGRTISTKRVLAELLAAYNENSAAAGFYKAKNYEPDLLEQLETAQDVVTDILQGLGFRDGVDYRSVKKDTDANGTRFTYWRMEAIEA